MRPDSRLTRATSLSKSSSEGMLVPRKHLRWSRAMAKLRPINSYKLFRERWGQKYSSPAHEPICTGLLNPRTVRTCNYFFKMNWSPPSNRFEKSQASWWKGAARKSSAFKERLEWRCRGRSWAIGPIGVRQSTTAGRMRDLHIRKIKFRRIRIINNSFMNFKIVSNE